jgi:MoaA/NifB/PqqE/SkfB family radical SAM enzyme
MRLVPVTAVLGGLLKSKLARPVPLVLAHEVTEACNLRCTFCSYWRDRKKREEELDFGAIKELIRQAKGLGVAWYCVTGGEPLLRSDISELVRYASRERMITSLITNGVLLTERIADIAPHLDFLSISIDTLSSSKYKHLRGSDCLSTVLAGVDRIKAEFPQLKTSINAVLMAETLAEVGDLVRFAADKGIGITFEPVVPQDLEACPTWGAAEEFDRALTELLRLRKEYPKVIWNTEYYLSGVLERRRYVCHAETLIRVDSAGNVVAPCYDHRDSAILGNVRERSLKELLKSERAMALHAKAHTCERRDCYLMCYAEPSMVIESNLCALKGMCGLLGKFW